MEKEKLRKPFLALTFAMLSPGLGQIYNGQLKKGLILYFFMTIGFLYLFKITGVFQSFPITVTILLLIVIIQIYFIRDAFITARRFHEYRLKAYNKGYIYFGIVLLTTILYNVQTALFPYKWQVGTHTFNIPTPSMEPTIQVGDKIVADFSVSKKSIKTGDLVFFKPSDGQNVFYISRIVAMPGDRFSMIDDFLILNGRKSKVEKISADKFSDTGNKMYCETLSDGKKIFIYKSERYDPAIANRGEVIIPRDSVMVVSDNRDNAVDSRYQGYIPLKNISGKVLFTFWGGSKNRVGIDLTKK